MIPSNLQVILLLCIVMISCSIEHEQGPPKRPDTMPVGAVFAPSIKSTGFWQACWMGNGGVVRCRISNIVGVVITDDEFIVYRGAPVKSEADLKIVPMDTVEMICLSNKTILMPKTDSQDTKKFLDFFNTPVRQCLGTL